MSYQKQVDQALLQLIDQMWKVTNLVGEMGTLEDRQPDKRVYRKIEKRLLTVVEQLLEIKHAHNRQRSAAKEPIAKHPS